MQINDIAIDNRKPLHAGARELIRGYGTERAAAYNKHSCFLDSPLPRLSYRFESYLAVVAPKVILSHPTPQTDYTRLITFPE